MPSLTETTTELLFWSEPYSKEFSAKIVKVTKEGIILDRTLFYPEGGGQIADRGVLRVKSNPEKTFSVSSVIKTEEGIIHLFPDKSYQTLTVGA